MNKKYCDRLYTTAELDHLGRKLNGNAFALEVENDELLTLKGLIKKYPHLTDTYLDFYWENVEREIDKN